MKLFRLPKHKPGAMAGESIRMRIFRYLLIFLLFAGVVWGFWVNGQRLSEMTKKRLGENMDRAPVCAVTIHTDGSCLGNPGPGGWAARLAVNGHVKFLSGGFARTTNNRMEIFAAVMALAALTRPCSVDLFTDSRYVRDAVEKRWLANWQRKGWKKADGKPVLNRDLWEKLAPLLGTHKVRLHWVEGHAGHAENEAVDTLARKEAARPGLPVDSGFGAL
jgi:ribonuclease HI